MSAFRAYLPLLHQWRNRPQNLRWLCVSLALVLLTAGQRATESLTRGDRRAVVQTARAAEQSAVRLALLVGLMR